MRELLVVLLRLCLLGSCLTMMTAGSPQGRSIWVPSSPEKHSAWVPIATGSSSSSSSKGPTQAQSTPLGQFPPASGSSPKGRKLYHNAFSKDPNTFRPFYWDTIVSMVLERVTGRMYGYNEFELLEHQCAYRTSPVLMNWSLQILTKVWCPGWTHITGTAIATRMPRSIEFATRDFVNKALNDGIISVEDAQVWLQSSNSYSYDQ